MLQGSGSKQRDNSKAKTLLELNASERSASLTLEDQPGRGATKTLEEAAQNLDRLGSKLGSKGISDGFQAIDEEEEQELRAAGLADFPDPAERSMSADYFQAENGFQRRRSSALNLMLKAPRLATADLQRL
eukprot:g27475.t1